MSRVSEILKIQISGAKQSHHEVWLRSLLALEAVYAKACKVLPAYEAKDIERTIEEILDAGPFQNWHNYPAKEEAEAADLL